MSDWLKSQGAVVKGKLEDLTQETPKQETVVEEEPKVETPVENEVQTEEKEVVETPTDEALKEESTPVEPQAEQQVEELTQAQEEERQVLGKTKIEYKEWLNENRDALRTYLNETSTDYSSLDPQELVKLKIAKDNPQWTEKEVNEELADRYGLGLSKVEIDEENMTDEELNEAKAHNREVDKAISRGSRLLKTDAKKAADEFEANKANIELPEFEFELPQATEKPLDAELLNEEINRAAKEYKEKQWLPVIEETFKDFNSIKKTVEYNDNGNKVVIDVNYKLSDKEIGELKQFLGDYTGHPSDNKYVGEDGQADMKAFVADKGGQHFLDSLLSTVAKEAAARARQEFVKKDLVNYQDNPTNTVPTEESSLADLVWGASKRKR